jgi:hypothetical protein
MAVVERARAGRAVWAGRMKTMAGGAERGKMGAGPEARSSSPLRSTTVGGRLPGASGALGVGAGVLAGAAEAAMAAIAAVTAATATSSTTIAAILRRRLDMVPRVGPWGMERGVGLDVAGSGERATIERATIERATMAVSSSRA